MPKALAGHLITEIVQHLSRGETSVAELALRYGITQAAVHAYRAGRRGHPDTRIGRPRKLTEVEEHTVWEVWSRAEASMLELATIYGVTCQTIRNVLRRHPQYAEHFPDLKQSAQTG